VPNFIKHILKDLKVHRGYNTVVVGDFNNPLLPIDRSSKQKSNKEILELNDTINQMDLQNISSNNSTIYNLLISPWNFLQIDHILEHKESLSKYKKTEITLCILSDHNALKLEINNKNNNIKYAYN
jgi:endonuclease/exonuclease/phosphatase family metal-dependent hydrolase